MMNQIIPTGMTEKEYFEVHASQAEFLDWYHKQALPQYEKHGFKMEGIRPKSMKVNGRFVDEYYMGKILD